MARQPAKRGAPGDLGGLFEPYVWQWLVQAVTERFERVRGQIDELLDKPLGRQAES